MKNMKYVLYRINGVDFHVFDERGDIVREPPDEVFENADYNTIGIFDTEQEALQALAEHPCSFYDRDNYWKRRKCLWRPNRYWYGDLYFVENFIVDDDDEDMEDWEPAGGLWFGECVFSTLLEEMEEDEEEEE